MSAWSRKFHQEIGRRMREVRLERGLTQEALAGAIGIESATLSRYEGAHIAFPLDVLRRAAEALDLPISAIVDVAKPAPKADHQEVRLLAIWRRLDPARRKLALRVFREIARPT